MLRILNNALRTLQPSKLFDRVRTTVHPTFLSYQTLAAYTYRLKRFTCSPPQTSLTAKMRLRHVRIHSVNLYRKEIPEFLPCWLRNPFWRKQVGELVVGMIEDASENVFKIREVFDFGPLGRGDERVDNRGALGAVMRAREITLGWELVWPRTLQRS